MFVAKNELENARKLTQIQRRNSTRNGGLLIFILVFSMIFLVNLIPGLGALLEESDRMYVSQWQDFSWTLSFGIIAGIIISICLYRQTNRYFEVYPQTNTSRFLAAQALYHRWIVYIAIIILAMYLIPYAIVAALAVSHKNIHFVYNFDIGFIVAGFFVAIIYLSIITAFISLIAVLIRKFRLYAVIILIVAVAFVVANITGIMNVFKTNFGFLLSEHSVGLFIVKGILIWAALFIIAFLVNKHTVYYRNPVKSRKGAVIGIVVVVAALCAAGTVLVPVQMMVDDPALVFDNNYDNNMADEFESWNAKKVEFDISGLPDGSKIDVVTSGDMAQIKDTDMISGRGTENDIQFIEYEDGTKIEYPNEYMIYEDDGDLQAITGKKLIVEYRYPINVYDSQDISNLINPNLNVRFEDATLYLDYSYEKNTKAVFMPVWSFMRQFDCFKGKELFNEQSGSTYATADASISIYVE